MPTEYYCAYGCSIRTDLNLGSLLPRGVSGRHRVTLRNLPTGSSPVNCNSKLDFIASFQTAPGKTHTLYGNHGENESGGSQLWSFEVDGIVRFYWRGGSGTIEYQVSRHATLPQICYWVIHMLLPLYVTLEGLYEVIHASAVVIGENATLFTAPSHGGKSSLANAFVRSGCELIADDCVPIEIKPDGCFVEPSHPNCRPYRKNNCLGDPVENFASTAIRIGAIYQVQLQDTGDDISFTELGAHEKLACLLSGAYISYGLTSSRRLTALADLADLVTMFSVRLPRRAGRIEECRNAILSHRHELHT